MIRRDPPRRHPRGEQRPESLRAALLRDSLLDGERTPLDGPRRNNPYAAYDPGPRTGLVIALVLLQAAAVGMALLAASLWQATRPDTALPAQARGLATLTEVDALITLRSADLQRQLDTGSDALILDGFPVRDVSIGRREAESADGTLDPAAYREALLAASASAVYERGLAALRAPDAAPSDRLIEGLIATLTRHRHSQAAVAVEASVALVVVLGLLLLLAARGQRWLAVGLALASGGALTFVLTLAARGALATLDTPPGAVITGYASLSRTLLDLPAWNALAVLVLGVALAVPGVLGRRRG